MFAAEKQREFCRHFVSPLNQSIHGNPYVGKFGSTASFRVWVGMQRNAVNFQIRRNSFGRIDDVAGRNCKPKATNPACVPGTSAGNPACVLSTSAGKHKFVTQPHSKINSVSP